MKYLIIPSLLLLTSCASFQQKKVKYPRTVYEGCVGTVKHEYWDVSFVEWDCLNGIFIKGIYRDFTFTMNLEEVK